MNVKRRFQFCTRRCRQLFDLDSSVGPYACHVGVHPRNMGSTETVLTRRRRWNSRFVKLPLFLMQNPSLTQTLDGETEWSGMMQGRTPVLPNGILINLVWPMTALRALPVGFRGIIDTLTGVKRIAQCGGWSWRCFRGWSSRVGDLGRLRFTSIEKNSKRVWTGFCQFLGRTVMLFSWAFGRLA